MQHKYMNITSPPSPIIELATALRCPEIFLNLLCVFYCNIETRKMFDEPVNLHLCSKNIVHQSEILRCCSFQKLRVKSCLSLKFYNDFMSRRAS